MVEAKEKEQEKDTAKVGWELVPKTEQVQIAKRELVSKASNARGGRVESLSSLTAMRDEKERKEVKDEIESQVETNVMEIEFKDASGQTKTMKIFYK